jgi:quinol monooxygenase YgiN
MKVAWRKSGYGFTLLISNLGKVTLRQDFKGGILVVSTEISWVFEAAIKPDDLNEYSALAREISADNQAAEPGQQIFEWFVDGPDVHIYERYQDSAAAVAHVQRFVANFGAQFMSLCTPTRMSVYGEPSDELKEAVAGFNPRYLGPLAGHARS